MVTFLIIIGRVPAIMRFRGIFSSQKVIFIDLLKIKSLAIANPDFDENYIFDRSRSRRIFRGGVVECVFFICDVFASVGRKRRMVGRLIGFSIPFLRD